MKTYLRHLIIPLALILITISSGPAIYGQACTPAGNQATYGTNNVWLGYVYTGINFNTYRGYVTAGTTASNSFDQNFGGGSVSYATNGCPVNTELFSVRYRLTKTYSGQNVDFTVSGDDGFRLSIDGGATWLINRWNDQAYATGTASVYMNGTYNLVLEYYENSGDNRITFSSVVACTGAGNPNVYGTNSTWQAYIYQGVNFNVYKGSKTEGTTVDPNFDENFGGDNVSMAFLTCPINTEGFSARFRLTRNMPAGTYVFTIGGDDGYRFSLDGGATWVIDRWFTQSYNVTSYTTTLSGSHNMVIEYFENTGGNRISFTMSASLLPVKLRSFNANLAADGHTQLNWSSENENNFNRYIIQRSFDGRNFSEIGSVKAKPGNALQNKYEYTDQSTLAGIIYYRLAMQDLDGTINYSSIATINSAKPGSTKLYPTVITAGTVYLQSAKTHLKANIELFDMKGSKVAASQVNIIAGNQQLYLPAATNGKGTFTIRITGQDGLIHSQVIILQ